jgi:hypothetical protein
MKIFNSKVEGNPSPSIEVVDGFDNELLATFNNWNVKEAMDGYTVDELDNLVELILEVRNYIAQEDTEQMSFDFAKENTDES